MLRNVNINILGTMRKPVHDPWLLARSILVPCSVVKRVPFPQVSQEQTSTILIEELLLISKLKGQFQLTINARRYAKKLLVAFNTETHTETEYKAAYYTWKLNHIYKLAMVLSAMKRNDLIISMKHMHEAESMLTGLEDSRWSFMQKGKRR
jgi:hypothetical protein